MSLVYIGPPHPSEKVSDEQVRQMRQRRADGETLTELAQCFDLGIDYIRHLCRGSYRAAAGGPLTLGHEERHPDVWFTAAWHGLSWESAKLLAS